MSPREYGQQLAAQTPAITDAQAAAAARILATIEFEDVAA